MSTHERDAIGTEFPSGETRHETSGIPEATPDEMQRVARFLYVNIFAQDAYQSNLIDAERQALDRFATVTTRVEQFAERIGIRPITLVAWIHSVSTTAAHELLPAYEELAGMPDLDTDNWSE